jgi:hypothetical protein
MDIKELRENLSYDPDTGEIRWISSGTGRQLGEIAGNKEGKVQVCSSKLVLARVAWALHYGEDPSHWVLHLNGDKSDLRICNLVLYESESTYLLIRKKHAVGRAAIDDDWIRSNVSYCSESGFIFIDSCGEKTRTENETVCNGKEYMISRIGPRRILSHRLAWFLNYGAWPIGVIDHENHNGRDNRIVNLRNVTHAVNLRNAKRSKANKSGVTGVYWNKKSGKWHVSIGGSDRGKSMIYLGQFSDIEEAKAARKKAEEELGYHKNHGKETTT